MNFPTIDRSFFAGECFDAYRVLGAHPCRDDFGQEGWRFAVWAPGAVAVEICGGFDGWGPGVPMQKADTGVWSGFVPGLAEGELYKYRIHGKDGSTVMRADPYAFSTELRPGTASRLARMDFAFDDSSWMERRDKCRNLPLNIYELHAGSWKHKPNATREDGSDGWYNYRELARELEKNLEAGEQSILFLNRRGNSRELLCPQCGYVPQCPRCSVYLTYHSANGRMMCHYCGYSEKSSEACPECGGAMKHIGVGTQRAEEELHALFPEAEILRMDADTVSQGHEKILRDFQVRRVPILLGTQMVAKGLDFANVTLVGVLAADMSLYVDHYRASERTFSLLTQVVGRAGRGDKPGRAVIQTYTPQNDVILAAADQDYDRFYDGEIRLRQLRRDPPFADQFFITVTGPQEGPVRRAAAGLRDGLRSAAGQEPYRGMALDILGPAPAPVVKVNNRYRYRVTVIGRNDKTLRGLLSAFMKEFSRRPEHKALHIYTDCNLMD